MDYQYKCPLCGLLFDKNEIIDHIFIIHHSFWDTRYPSDDFNTVTIEKFNSRFLSIGFKIEKL